MKHHRHKREFTKERTVERVDYRRKALRGYSRIAQEKFYVYVKPNFYDFNEYIITFYWETGGHISSKRDSYNEALALAAVWLSEKQYYFNPYDNRWS